MQPQPLAEAIAQLELIHFHNPDTVRGLIQQIVLLKGERVGALFPHQRRLAALQALVERLMAAHELEEAVSAARLVEDMLRWGQLDRAQEVAAAIQDNERRSWALARIQAAC